MSWISSPIKIISCFATMGGAISCPFFFSSKDLIHVTPKVQEKVTWTLGESEQEGSGGLFLEDMNKINKLFADKKKSLSVDDVGMKFGDKTISSKDILISPCENEKYYLMKYVGDPWYYELKRGVKLPTLNCRDKHLYGDVEHVNLKWGKPINGRTIHLPVINLSDCIFTKDNGDDIRVTCNKNQWARELQFTFKSEGPKHK